MTRATQLFSTITQRGWPLLVAVALLATLPMSAQAQWRWRDKDGQVNASDRPPPKGIAEKDIISRPAPDQRRSAAPAAAASGAASAAAQSPLEREVQARKRASEQEQSAKTKAEQERISALRAENCRAARSQLTALESGQRIARTNDKGEREILDDKGRADETRRAREAINSECR